MEHSALMRGLIRHPVATLMGMTACFMAFGALTLDLARVLTANAQFLAEHGWDAIRDAGLWQLGGLALKSMGAMLLWVGLKLGEYALVQRLSRGLHD